MARGLPGSGQIAVSAAQAKGYSEGPKGNATELGDEDEAATAEEQESVGKIVEEHDAEG